MDSRQKFTEEMMSEQVKKAREVVESVTFVDIHNKRRLRSVVDARMIYAKILREDGMTFKSIGRTIGKDHTTIMYYIGMLDSLIESDPALNSAYAKCRDLFFAGREEHKIEFDQIQAAKKIREYMDLYDKAKRERDNAVDFSRRLRRLSDIVQLIDERTPKGQEKRVWTIINRMFNGGLDNQDE
jgi:hypothetical protein